jgi:hypothetical protein
VTIMGIRNSDQSCLFLGPIYLRQKPIYKIANYIFYSILFLEHG